VWLLAGYHLGAGKLTLIDLLGLWLAAQLGRQVGALALYHVARLSSVPLTRFYEWCKRLKYWPKIQISPKMSQRIHLTSPFSIAYGRLLGLRIPLTIMLAFKKKLVTALVAVLFSSIVWDGIYLILGSTVGRTAILSPVQMFFASIAGLTVLYLATLLIRHLLKRPKPSGD
jgi:hypothetical protein